MRTVQFLFLSCLLLVAACTSQTTENLPPATLYPAKSVITMNPAAPRAEAVVVQDGTIIGVGSSAELQAQFSRYNLTVDERFANQIIMPGFIEPHLHPYLAALILQTEFIAPHDWTLLDTHYPGSQSEEDYRARLTSLADSLPAGAWLKTWGYHQYFHGQLGLNELDRLIPDRPALIWHRSFHEVYLNSAAMQALGIQRSKEAPEQADFDNGHFYETGLAYIFPNLAALMMSPQNYLQALNKAARIIQRGGITTVGDGAFGSLDFKQEMGSLMTSDWNKPDTPFRTLLLIDGKHLGDKIGSQQTHALVEKYSAVPVSEHIQVQNKQIKLFADGAAYSQLMQMSEGYLDGHHGEWLMTPQQLAEAMRFYWQRDYQIHIHVNGDAGLDVILDTLAELQAEQPRDDHRTTLHHFAYARPDQIQRIAKLGALVQANPYYLWALADKYSDVGLGPERAANMVPSGSVVNAGIPLAFHSDFTMAPAQPLLLAWAAATRKTASGNTANPGEKISLDEALQAITIDAAFQLNREKEIGSIEVGKRADFTVLAQDPYLLPIEQLKDITIIGTVLGGKPAAQ